MNKLWKYTLTFLALILVVILIAIFQFPDSRLHIITCNVGQGDAILFTYGNTQILTDGGPDKSVLSCLGKYMPFWDKEIELVVLTHPDADHATGVVYVTQAYKVDKILINPIDPGTPVYQALRNEVGGRGIPVINPTTGMSLRLGLIYLDVLSPNDLSFVNLSVAKEGDSLSKYNKASDTNLYSIVYLLRFGEFKALMLGDIPQKVSDSLASAWQTGSVEYIKIPHHGSVNGLTDNLVRVVMPKIAVISVGKNSWGFPKKEILEMLEKYNVKVIRTDEVGDIETITDGKKFWTK